MKTPLQLLPLLLASLLLVSCTEKEAKANAEDAGDAVEEAVDEAEDAVNEGVDAVKDAAEEAGDAVEDATDRP